jgi:hypothetical protein
MHFSAKIEDLKMRTLKNLCENLPTPIRGCHSVKRVKFNATLR